MAILRALLFDVDGTLADTERDGHRVAFNQAFHEAGLNWEWSIELYDDLLSVTGGKERIRFFIEKYQPNFFPEEEIDDYIKRLHQRKTHFYLQLLRQGNIPLRSGVTRLLKEARAAGLRLAIVTTTTPENVTHLIQSTLGNKALDWFEVIAAGDIVPAKKPAPDIYHYTLEKMKLQPEECLAFEDSNNGLRSALGAKLRTIVTTNAYTQQHNFSDAMLVVDRLGEPNQAFKVQQGHVGQASFVDVTLLHKLYEQY